MASVARSYILDKKRKEQAGNQRRQKCLQICQWTYEYKRKNLQRDSRTTVIKKKTKLMKFSAIIEAAPSSSDSSDESDESDAAISSTTDSSDNESSHDSSSFSSSSGSSSESSSSSSGESDSA